MDSWPEFSPRDLIAMVASGCRCSCHGYSLCTCFEANVSMKPSYAMASHLLISGQFMWPQVCCVGCVTEGLQSLLARRLGVYML